MTAGRSVGMKTPFFCSLALAGLLAGCAYDRRTGNVVPPDPIGRALVNAVNPGPQYGYEDGYSDYSYEPREYTVVSERPVYRVRDTRPPRPDYRDPVYVPSETVWTGSSWQQVPGRWVERPRSGARYVRGHYYQRGGNRYYRSGYWR